MIDRRAFLGLALAPLAARARGQAPPALPALEREPELGVFLARGARLSLELEAPARLEADGRTTALAAGRIELLLRGDGWSLAGAAGEPARGPGRLSGGGGPVFQVDAQPEFGAPRRLRLAGDLIVQPARGALELVERVPLETYLASAIGAEMNPRWPAAALAAQAIVARSYAAARWMERRAEPWHLHWHFGVDMAYHGWSEGVARVARAIAPTRGEMLVYRGFPVLALFHASSGGRTESFERVKPGVLAPDGKTPIAPAMPVVADDAALPGAAGLGLASTHGRWKTDVPLPELTRSLAEWSAAAAGRPRLGSVEAVSVEGRHDDSGRVARVSVRHRLDGATRFTELGGPEFRLAAGPVRIRSLAWDRCVVASQPPGYLVLEGRGFGHGCGLSQVSAWYLAQRGLAPEEIVARFYAGARIERRY